jgi:hypothetical protein
VDVEFALSIIQHRTQLVIRWLINKILKRYITVNTIYNIKYIPQVEDHCSKEQISHTRYTEKPTHMRVTLHSRDMFQYHMYVNLSICVGLDMSLFSDITLGSFKNEVHNKYKLTNSVALVHEPTIPTKRPPFVGEVSANFCG